jgi:hypothetical protein
LTEDCDGVTQTNCVLVQQRIEDELTQQILDGRIRPKQTIVISVSEGTIIVRSEEPVAEAAEGVEEEAVAV